MSKKKIIFLIIVVVGAFFLLSSNNLRYVKINGVTLKVSLALTERAQERGLSGRESLEENEGMLFVFSQPIARNFFWMKEMNFPLDMIWFGADKKVVYIKKNATPESYPESFGPNEETKYVLEVISGFSDKYNLKEGDLLEF